MPADGGSVRRRLAPTALLNWPRKWRDPGRRCQPATRALATADAAELDAVSRDFEAMGDVLAAADAAAHAATVHRRDGHRGSALTSSGRAQLLAKQCGGAVSPALAAAKLPLPFTRREHEITRLLSRGLSNKEIAEALSLSVRTVEGHVYQASTKVGIS